MEAYLEQYRHKDIRDLHTLVKEAHHLSYDAKRALRFTINERNFHEEFTDEEIVNLDNYIEVEEQKKETLGDLSNLGLEYSEEDGKHILTITKAEQWNNIWGITIGFTMFLIGMMLLISTFANMKSSEASVFSILLTALGAIVAVSGISMLYKAILRTIRNKGFSLTKSDEGVLLKYRPDFKLEQIQLQSNSTFILTADYHNAKLTISDTQQKILLFTYKEVQDLHVEAIKTLNKRF